MLNTANLSLEQAPPISIPFRFFITAPLFGMIAAIFMLGYGADLIGSRWLPATLAMTHAITLGMLTMVMCGALMQMLPVLTGSPLPAVRQVGTGLHLALIVGTVSLQMAFLKSESFYGWLAIISLAIGFGAFFFTLGIAFFRITALSPTITGMRYSVVALLVTLVLGVLLLLSRLGLIAPVLEVVWTNVHLTWGLLGWIALLIIAVAYQIVPMFYVTPEFPYLMRKGLVTGLFLFLLLWTAQIFLPETQEFRLLLLILILTGMVLFAMVSLRLLYQKRRKVRDLTLWFWAITFACLMLGVVFQLLKLLGVVASEPQISKVLLGVLALISALSVVNGMLYKIVPFLSWFHLQNRQIALMSFSATVPHMKALLSERLVIWQFAFWLGCVLLTLLAILADDRLIYLAGGAFLVSNVLLIFGLARVMYLYHQVNRTLHSEGAKSAGTGV